MTDTSMRERLRRATSDAHERLHSHAGLSAAATGAIDLGSYRALLIRLYGFHRAFDARAAAYAHLLRDAGIMRSELLESDLRALGVVPADAPICPTLPPILHETQALGALYVVEGSALGGASISRALAPVLSPLNGAGSRFFSNDGGRRRCWRDLLARIESLAGEPEGARAAIDAAIATFQAFEDWMEDWVPDPARAAFDLAEICAEP